MGHVREWTDENTGRKARQLTDLPGGAKLDYFRQPRHLPDGLLLVAAVQSPGTLLFLDPESAEVEHRELPLGRRLKLRESDGRLWYIEQTGKRVMSVDLPSGEPEIVAELPDDLPGHIVDITCDGGTLILAHTEELGPPMKVPLTKDAEALWRFFERPRRGWIRAYDLPTGKLTTLVETEGVSTGHHDTSPADPGLLKYCQDHHDAVCQRVWAVRVDGSGLRKIRPQEKKEFITHEFWWPDGEFVGYTYQDRRNDDTLRELPWGEYAPVPTHLGVAGLDGEECYLSDPLNHYHSHVFVSGDARWAIGDGTDGHSFVYVAPFSFQSTRLDFIPLATVHTPYRPFAGQAVEPCMTEDARWMLYNDTIEGKMQVCVVRVDI